MLITPLGALRILTVLDSTGAVNKMIKKSLSLGGILPILVEIEALNEGIIPYFDREQLSKSLSSLPPDEARKMRRKFRKIHRKLQKTIVSVNPRLAPDFYGEKSKDPTPTQKARRKNLVLEYLQLRSVANASTDPDDK